LFKSSLASCMLNLSWLSDFLSPHSHLLELRSLIWLRRPCWLTEGSYCRTR
jgi:hypothetical protein